MRYVLGHTATLMPAPSNSGCRRKNRRPSAKVLQYCNYAVLWTLIPVFTSASISLTSLMPSSTSNDLVSGHQTQTDCLRFCHITPMSLMSRSSVFTCRCPAIPEHILRVHLRKVNDIAFGDTCTSWRSIVATLFYRQIHMRDCCQSRFSKRTPARIVSPQ